MVCTVTVILQSAIVGGSRSAVLVPKMTDYAFGSNPPPKRSMVCFRSDLARRMGGALAIPINSCGEVDGFREGLNPSYALRQPEDGLFECPSLAAGQAIQSVHRTAVAGRAQVF
jgi:hypothetical protein